MVWGERERGRPESNHSRRSPSTAPSAVPQPLQLSVQRQLSARSDRVKAVDVHPTEPWVLAVLYNGIEDRTEQKRTEEEN